MCPTSSSKRDEEKKLVCPHHYHRGDTSETVTLLTELTLAGDKK